MQRTHKQLAQRIPNGTGNFVLYQPPSSDTVTYIKLLIVCNTTAASKTYSIWINQNGTEVADRFAIIKNIPLAATASDQRIYSGTGDEDFGIVLRGSSASIMISASAADSVNFTLYGTEVVEN